MVGHFCTIREDSDDYDYRNDDDDYNDDAEGPADAALLQMHHALKSLHVSHEPQTSKTHVAFVIDISKSMSLCDVELDGQPASRYDCVARSLLGFVSEQAQHYGAQQVGS